MAVWILPRADEEGWGIIILRWPTIIAMCLALVCVVGNAAFAQWIPLGDSSPTQSPWSLTLTENTDDGLIINFTLHGFNLATDGQFDQVAIPDAAFVGEIGKPALPSIRKLIQIPAQSDFRVEIIDVASEHFDGLLIDPQQPFVTDSQAPPPFVIDADAYATDRPFPDYDATLKNPAIWGGLRTATLIINPLRFNPRTGRLTAASRIRFKIVFEGLNDHNALAREPQFVSPDRRRMYSKTLLNYSDNPQAPLRADAQTTYLIIVDEAFEDHEKITELAARHTESGHSVEIVTAQGIVGEEPAADIKAYIRGVYEQSSPPMLEYVLFIGDKGLDHIPWIEGATGKYGDTYYTFLDGDDYLSDLALGRLPAKSDEELIIMIDKILYWSGDDFGGDWLGISLLTAHRQGYPDKYTAVSEAVRNYEYRLPAPIFTTQYGGEEATNNSLTAQINEGRFIINYRGHGNSVSWLGWSDLGEYFNTDDVAALGNGGHPAILFSIACENADMGRDDPCFAESWMIHPTGGAAAVLGSIYGSYTIPNDEFNKYLFKAIYDDGITNPGYILNKANADLYAHFAGDPTYESYTQQNIEMYLWLGDPAMSLPIAELDAPYNLGSRALDSARIVLDWIDQSEDEDYFRLEISESETGDWQVLENLPADETSYEYGNFTEAQGAYFRLKAVRGEIESYYSNVVYAQSLPAAPTNLHAHALSVSSIHLIWSDNSQGETSQKILRRGPGESVFHEAAEMAADLFEFTDEGLREGSVYEYLVEAISLGGGAQSADLAQATTLCAAPVELVAESREDMSVTLHWRDVSEGEQRFIVYRKTPFDAPDWEIIGYADTDAAHYTDSTVGEAQRLAWAISAENSGGIGPKSETCFALTIPAAPQALAAHPVSSSSIQLVWSDISQGETHLSLTRSTDGETWAERAFVPVDAESFTDTGLVEGQMVFYRLHAVNEAGQSPAGNTTQTRTLPARPAMLNAVPVDAGVSLTWTDNSEAESGFRIERRFEEGAFDTVASVGENEMTFIDTSAPPRKLVYRVAAFHEYGDSEYSEHAEIVKTGEGSDDGGDQDVSGDNGDGGNKVGGDEQDDSGGGCGW